MKDTEKYLGMTREGKRIYRQICTQTNKKDFEKCSAGACAGCNNYRIEYLTKTEIKRLSL